MDMRDEAPRIRWIAIGAKVYDRNSCQYGIVAGLSEDDAWIWIKVDGDRLICCDRSDTEVVAELP